MKRARGVMDALRANGHSIVYDWVDRFGEGATAEKALDEANAVRAADLLVYLWEPVQESARYVAGMAMGLNKPIVVSGDKDAFFFQLPNIYTVDNDEKIIEEIKSLYN